MLERARAMSPFVRLLRIVASSLLVSTSALVAMVSFAACSDDEAPTATPSGSFNAGTVTIPTGGACNVVVAEQPPLPSPHLPVCSSIPYTQSNPPSSGPHYPDWAAFKTYTAPVPRGFLVHDLEHGGVLVSYRCPDGCADEVAKAQKVIDAFVDAKCASVTSVTNVTSVTTKRATMSPDPLLASRFAVSAWGHTLVADCVDEAAFGAFMKAFADRAPESFCNEGVDVLSVGVPAGCGSETPTP